MAENKVKAPVTKGVAKVPVVMQMETLECGAACLCMVLAYYGRWIPLEQVRADCGVSRDGSSAKNVLKAARSYGLKAQGFRTDAEKLQHSGRFPCIVHWEFNHFVVLDGFRNGKAYLNDPSRGNYTVSVERFADAFTGIAMVMEPTEDFEPGGKPKSVVAFARSRLRGAEAAVAFVALTTVISSLLDIVNAGLARAFLDYLLPGNNPVWFTSFFIAMGIVIFIQLVSSWIQAVYSLRLNGKMAAVGNATYLWKVLKLPMSFFSQRMAGDIQSRQDANASIAEEVVNTLAPLALDTAMMIFYLTVMIRYSWLLTLVGVASVAANLLLSRIISRKRVNITRVSMRDQGKLAGATVGAVDMIESIKASGAENGYFEKWAGYQASVNTQGIRYEKLNQYLGVIPRAITGLLNIAVLILGIWLTMKGEFTVGMILAFQGFMSEFMAPAGQIISAGQEIQEMRTDMERIEDVMEFPEDEAFAPRPEAEHYDKLKGGLSMRDVSFGYSRLAPPVIEDFNLELEPGKWVALVGSTASGKSTLAKLISGLYQAWDGEIQFDGKPIGEIDRSVLTGSVAVVDQDIILFEDTIANNIKMWDTSIEDFEMIMAARDARIHEDIMQRDGGYQYKITEGGRDFSGGQRQRMEIARVLAQDPTMIILDEATSALDAKTEFEVMKAIRARGVSCVVVAHRLSAIRDCDEIIVLDHGRIVERGTHDQLMAMDGAYKALVSNE